MIHEVITRRWPCPVCGGPLRLVFVPCDHDGEGKPHDSECDEALCRVGHELPEELLEEIGRHADEELRRTLAGGLHVGELWQAPEDDGMLAPLE